MTFKTNIFKRIWHLLLSIGPGIFCIGYTIGSGSVTSMITSGSMHGMQLLWVLFLSAFFSWILMESFGRLAVVTGNTAINSFRNELKWGKFWAITTIIGVVLGQWSALSGILGLTSNAIYEVVRMFFPDLSESNYWAVLGIAVVIIFIMYAFLLVGKYSFFEKVLIIFVAVMGLSFIVSMFIVLPSPEEIAKGFIPKIPPGGRMMVAAFVGTTMAAPTFVVRPLIVKEKGWNKEHMKQQSKDALISGVFLFVISASIMVAATGALFNKGEVVTKVLDMVYALEPVAGKFAVVLFMFGAMSAGLSSIFPILMVLPLLIGDYRQGEMDVKSSSFKLLTAIACVVGLVVPVFGMNPIMAQIATQIASVFVLPVVIGGIIVLINQESRMGKNKAGLLLNIALFAALAFSFVISYTGILGLIDFFKKI